MVQEPLTAGELYRMFAILGASIIALSGLTSTIAAVIGARSRSRKDDHEEGARREQIRHLSELAKANETRWERHDLFVDARVEEFRETQGTVKLLAASVERLGDDVKSALRASAEASSAVTRLASRLAERNHGSGSPHNAGA